MKSLITIITGSALFFALTSSTPIESDKIVKGKEVHLKVALGYEGCACEPAVYQIQGTDLVKITDLEKIDKNNSSRSRSNNARTLTNVLSEIDLQDYAIKSMESIKRDDCGYDMFYVLIKRKKD